MRGGKASHGVHGVAECVLWMLASLEPQVLVNAS